ncbi:hypothetical protein CYMTET_34682, partial [Cymbomonas tetramitiformis]
YEMIRRLMQSSMIIIARIISSDYDLVYSLTVAATSIFIQAKVAPYRKRQDNTLQLLIFWSQLLILTAFVAQSYISDNSGSSAIGLAMLGLQVVVSCWAGYLLVHEYRKTFHEVKGRVVQVSSSFIRRASHGDDLSFAKLTRIALTRLSRSAEPSANSPNASDASAQSPTPKRTASFESLEQNQEQKEKSSKASKVHPTIPVEEIATFLPLPMDADDSAPPSSERSESNSREINGLQLQPHLQHSLPPY